MKKFTNSFYGSGCLPKTFRYCSLALLCSLSSSAFSAPGELADQPLSLVVSTKPNILLLLDDSGSMDLQTVVTDEAQSIHNVTVDNKVDGEAFSFSRTQVQGDEQLWVLCAGYNALAFNHHINYEKWKDYTDVTLVGNQSGDMTSVLDNPITSTKSDLSKDFYIIWNDTDDDGLYDYDPTNNIRECGPGVADYDSSAAGQVAIPASNGTLTVTSLAGIFTDNNGNGDAYVPEDGTLIIDIPGGGDASSDDIITFNISSFNVDRARLIDGDDDSRDTDSLTIFAGTDPDNPIEDAVTVTGAFYSPLPVDEDNGPNQGDPDGTYVNTEMSSLAYNTAGATLRLQDDSSAKRDGEVSRFTVKGSTVTLSFDGGTSTDNDRTGFVISWEHSSYTGDTSGDGLVTEEDCTDTVLNCQPVDELPKTNALAASNTPATPYRSQENYANWYTYYRQRNYVAKKALSDLVFDSTYRIGFTTINDNGEGGALIRDVENTVDDSLSAHQNKLLEKIYAAATLPDKGAPNTDEGTPLITALSNAGRYFTEGEDPDSHFFGTDASSVAIASTHSENDDAAHEDNSKVVSKSPIFTNDNGGHCQQNFTLLFSDGAWSDDVTDLAGTDHDVNGDTAGFIGNYDDLIGTSSSSVVPDDPTDPDPYADNFSNTLADVAMYYFANDLSTSANNSLALSLHQQTITHQHMSTFTIGFGVSGDISVMPGSFTSAFTWDPQLDTDDNLHITAKEKIDDLRHAGFNGRGDYLTASNVESLKQALDEVISTIGFRLENTAAGSSFSALELEAGDFRYDTTYSTGAWWGELRSYARTTGEDNGGFADNYTWSAQDKMDARGKDRYNNDVSAGRQIITFNDTQRKGVAFQFPSDYNDAANRALSDKQLIDIFTFAPHRTADSIPTTETPAEVERNQVYGEVFVNYIRGDGTFDGQSLENPTIESDDSVNYTEGSSTIQVKASSASAVFDTSIDSPPELHAFRNRASPNGDEHYIGGLIHSQPLFVGEPNNLYPDDIESTAYSTFAGNDIHKNRRSMIYVGGNDGMLHGFYAKDLNDSTRDGGEEVFAYIPAIVSDATNGGRGLHRFTQESFEGGAYVDGSPRAADVFVDRDYGDNDEDPFVVAQWRSYLVGGLRAGGKGIYVLDVTNPDNTDSSIYAPRLSDAEDNADKIVVKEFTHEKLGHIYDEVEIAKMNNGRWAAIVGNGYNSASDGSGTASLFIVYLDKDIDGVLEAGVFNDGAGDYSIITASTHTWIQCAAEATCSLPDNSLVRYGKGGTFNTPESMAAGEFECAVDSFTIPPDSVEDGYCEYSDNNGLSQASVVDTDGNGTVDRIYAGDLHGNMWIFNVEGDDESAWGVHSKGADTNADKPFFTACDSSLSSDGSCPIESRQPITSKPLVRKHPLQNSSDTQPNNLVFFGTGQYLTEGDKANELDNNFYTVWDAGVESIALTPSSLTERKIVTNSENGNRTIESADVAYDADNNEFGWRYGDDADDGGFENKERVTLRPDLFENILLFVTLIPLEGSCNATAGGGNIMAVDALSGGNPSTAVLGQEGQENIAGIQVSSIIVGSSLIKTEDGGAQRIIKTADGEVEVVSLRKGGATASTQAGKLFNNKGRKSWSILR